MNTERITELLYEALETEKGGIKIYETALKYALNPDLKKEWEEYHQQTQNHKAIVLGVMAKLGLDPATLQPGRVLAAARREGRARASSLLVPDFEAPDMEQNRLGHALYNQLSSLHNGSTGGTGFSGGGAAIHRRRFTTR